MSHHEQQEFIATVKSHLPQYFAHVKVLEVGALNINGSCRSHFEQADYCGIDLDAGAGVDRIMQGQLADFASLAFDVCISVECFEHNPFWLETFINMARMSHGLVVMSCATTGRKEHGTTRTDPESSPLTVAKGWEYYQNLTPKDFTKRINLDNWFDDWHFYTNHLSHDLYFVGLRKQKLPLDLTQALQQQTSPYRSLKAFRRTVKAVIGLY